MASCRDSFAAYTARASFLFTTLPFYVPPNRKQSQVLILSDFAPASPSNKVANLPENLPDMYANRHVKQNLTIVLHCMF